MTYLGLDGVSYPDRNYWVRTYLHCIERTPVIFLGKVFGFLGSTKLDDHQGAIRRRVSIGAFKGDELLISSVITCRIILR